MTTITWTGPTFVLADGTHARYLSAERTDGVSTIVAQGFNNARRLPEGFALPGFIDSHAHLDRLGMRPDGLYVAGDATAAEIAAHVGRVAATREPGTWVVGRGWLAPCGVDRGSGPRLPTSRVLDEAAPNHPVSLKRADEHAIWANSVALKLAGIRGDTPDPPGGIIVRDESGAATGVLIDQAMNLVKAQIPEVTLAERRGVIADEAQKFLATGVTCVHDMAVRAPLATALQSLDEDGELPLRVRAFLWAGDVRNHPRMEHFADAPSAARLGFRGIKVFMDGALGSRGARLSTGYADGSRGVQLDSNEVVGLAVDAARRGGWQMAVHAIGDLAVHDAIRALSQNMPDPGSRWRVEHTQIISETDLQTMAGAGLCAAVQPVHGAHDLPWAAEMLGALLPCSYRWRSLMDAGIPMGLGTDHPIETLDVRRNLLAAIERKGDDGAALPGQDERLTRAQALDLYTRGSAYLAFDERWMGRLAPGYAADFVVWDTDLTTCPVGAIADAQVLAVVVDGELVFEAQ